MRILIVTLIVIIAASIEEDMRLDRELSPVHALTLALGE